MAQLGSEIKDREVMEGRFRRAREAYDALGGILVEKGNANVDVAIPVENRPESVFAEVTTLMGSNNINILDLYVRHSNTERAALVLTLDAKRRNKLENYCESQVSPRSFKARKGDAGPLGHYSSSRCRSAPSSSG